MLTGEELKRARGHLTKSILADMVGVSESTITAWEKRGVPEYNEHAIREALGLREYHSCLYYGVHTSSGTRFGKEYR